MDHFVHQNILQTFRRLLGQFQIQPDAPGADVTTPPLGLHFFDAPFGYLLTDDGFPFGNQTRHPLFEFGPIPLVESQLPVGDGGVGLDVQD